MWYYLKYKSPCGETDITWRFGRQSPGSNPGRGIKNMKKIFLIVFFAALFLFLPTHAEAACTELVPCGGEGRPACTICHLFELFDKVITCFLMRIVPLLAVLMILFGGGMFILSGGNPQTLNKAKSLLQTAVIGLVLVYAAWFIVALFLQGIGFTEERGILNHYSTWWTDGFISINCP